MALENADGGGGDWITNDQWDRLCKEKALGVFKILRIEPPSKPTETSRSPWHPVVVDMLILSGSYEGTVYRSERMTKAGFTNTLREKFHPEDADKKAKDRRKLPRTEGTDLVARFGTYQADGVTRFALNGARADDVKRVEELFAETGGDPYTAAEKAELESARDIFADTTPGDEISSGNMAGARMPAADPDDDEPPF